MAAEINPNALPGLASGLDTRGIIDKLMAAQEKQIEPIRERKEEKSVQFDLWKQVRAQLESIQSSAEEVSKKNIWESKLVTSSHPEVIEATATSKAKPGKYTLAVDKLALNHQIASQNFVAKDQFIGTGKVLIKIGNQEEVQTIVIDETNNTLQGLEDAINSEKIGLSATIVNTGNTKAPYQLVLTSDTTGSEGAIYIEFKFDGKGETPTFDSYYNQPTKWKGIGKSKNQQSTGSGASTAIPEFMGTYTGEDPLTLKFTAINTGIVGNSENLQLRWEDNQERFGYISLDSFSYSPGQPIDIIDGIQLIMSEGELIVNDTFTVEAKPKDSDLLWWVDEEDRPAKIYEPSPWNKQNTLGVPIVTGEYTGEDQDFYTLKVVGNGVVGEAEELKIIYESENGKKGFFFVGQGYKPGSLISMGDGLEFSIQKGILNEGDYATFETFPEHDEFYWWLGERGKPTKGKVESLTGWMKPELDEDGKEIKDSKKDEYSFRKSTATKEIVGKYLGNEEKVYTFTVSGTGSVGTTEDLELLWEDNKGNQGVLEVGKNYETGTPLLFDQGLSLVLGKGRVFDTDSFTFRTYTSVIQPPQDAAVRVGATSEEGGLLVTNPTNILKDVVEGVELELLSTSEKPVIIHVKGDTEKAMNGVNTFIENYNTLLMFIQEITKYDDETEEAAPLQGDRNLPRIQQSINDLFIQTVTGLEKDRNMLMSIGVTLTPTGTVTVDEEKLKTAIEEDLIKVANLFRSHGSLKNSGIIYLNSSDATKISGFEGYDIDITQAATKGFYASNIITSPILLDQNNNKVIVNLNGRDSNVIELETGNRSLIDITRELKTKLTEDENLGKYNFSVNVIDNRLVIRSETYGERSTANIQIAEGSNNSNPLLNGGSISGENVIGYVDGIEMESTGQLLIGPKDTHLEGLKLFSKLSEKQITEGPEDTMIFTKGVAVKVKEYLTQILEEKRGSLAIYTDNVEEQLKGYENQIKRMEERMDVKRTNLNTKFAKLEAQMGQLKSEQDYLTKQMAGLG